MTRGHGHNSDNQRQQGRRARRFTVTSHPACHVIHELGNMAAKVSVHYACPCIDVSKPPTLDVLQEDAQNDQVLEEAAVPFNPHDSRANFALYPVEHLLFCTECHELRCPRCSYEEALSAFCPSCLQERNSMSVNSESNR